MVTRLTPETREEPASTLIPIARPQLGLEEEAAVIEVMRSGALAQGERVYAFEREFARRVGARFGVATCNGTAALFLALKGHGIGTGDEVITSPLTFIATANAISHTGATPVFADIDETLNLDPKAVADLIGPRTRAIVPVHLHGNPADMHRFATLAETHGLALVQDACQAVGATISGEPLGTFGTAVYSLYATKNITTGEGGMIATNDPEVVRFCSSMRHQAYSDEPYVHDAIGHNFRMTEMEAAIGLVQLRKLDTFTEQRRMNAAYYDRYIAPFYERPRVAPANRHVYHQYTLRIPSGDGPSRDEVRAMLEHKGVATGVYYPRPLHLQPPYLELANPPCPNAERAAADMFSIPVHPAVSEDDLSRVAVELNRIASLSLNIAR
jgi:dTDP-4-amino-4,6-dideoxygalactose transaminase